jgi:short/branched chain acyl-CoA dehydrogenase
MLILVAVRRFANDVVAPKVREMDENEMMDPAVTKGLFDQGVRLLSSASFAVLIVANRQLMGIEIPSEFGGAESSFTSAILTIEELAKVDPSVSVMCDVHNTLVNTVVRKYGTKEQQAKYLPLLAQSSVRLNPPPVRDG